MVMPMMPTGQPMPTVASGGEGTPQMSPMGQPQMPQQGGPMPGPGLPPNQLSEPTDLDQDNDNDKVENYLNAALQDTNLARKFKNKEGKNGQNLLDEIGGTIVQWYNEDEISRKDWMDKNDKWLKMATLVSEFRTFPWPRASNVKYPLLATAAMQFSARAYPALVPSDGEIVKTTITQQNPSQDLYDAAQRVSRHMSYQIMDCIPDWEENMDKLLMMMAIAGICFKETFFDSLEKTNISQLVHPQDLCINYHATSLETAYRKTRILRFTDNEVETKFRSGAFLKFDIPKPTNNPIDDKPRVNNEQTPPISKATPHIFLACHTFWDLDGDGYEEPYIITVHKDTQKVVRIIARYDLDGIKYDETKKKVLCIKPVEYFTAFPFIPNPDGSCYALGFGTLLGPLNESADTIINQLIDSGTLNNLQAGFIGKGLRIKIGQSSFQPGEWKVVNATGDDLKNQIFPLPTKEPSAVLLNLLNMLITSGNQLASIAEIFVGKMPGQNTPATTTQETIQQGMAVFTAIYKRVYRSLSQEFCKIFRLNKLQPDIVQQESKIAGLPLQQSDYDLPDSIIIPAADPVGDSSTVKMAKLQQVGQLLQLGTINPLVYTQRVLEANEVPNAKELIAQPQPPQPDPKIQVAQMKAQSDQQKTQIDMQAKQQDMEIKKQMAQLDAQMKAIELQFEQTKQAMEIQGKQAEMKMNQVQQANEMRMDSAQMQHDMMINQMKGKMELQYQNQVHQQQMQQGAQQHQQAMKQGEQNFKQKQKQVKLNGGSQKGVK